MNTRLLSGLLALGLSICSANADVPFPGAGSNYGGTIDADASSDPNNSGILTVVMNDKGAASLVLVWQGQTYRLKGLFTGDSTFGQFNTDIPKKTPQTPGTNLSLACNLDPNTRTITGVVSDPEATGGGGFSLDGNVPDPALVAQLDPGLRMAFVDDAVAPAPREGPQRSSFGLPPLTGTGFAVVSVGKSSKRSNKTVGRLADDQPYSAGSPLRSRSYALRSGLYSQGKGQASGGQVLGNSNLSTSALPESGQAPRSLASFIAALRWHKRPNLPNANAFPAGFDGRVNLDTLPYNRNADVRFVLRGERINFSNASLILSGGRLGGDITVKLNLTAFGAKIIGPNPNKVTLSAQPLAAKFMGTFRPDPAQRETVQFHGALRSSTGVVPNVVPGEGKGSFLQLDRNDPNNSQSGKVRIKAS